MPRIAIACFVLVLLAVISWALASRERGGIPGRGEPSFSGQLSVGERSGGLTSYARESSALRTFRVVDAVTGEFLESGVRFYYRTENEWLESEALDGGRFVVRASCHRVYCYAPGYAPALLDVSREVDVVDLSRGGSMTVRVVGADSEPLEGVQVALIPPVLSGELPSSGRVWCRHLMASLGTPDNNTVELHEFCPIRWIQETDRDGAARWDNVWIGKGYRWGVLDSAGVEIWPKHESRPYKSTEEGIVLGKAPPMGLSGEMAVQERTGSFAHAIVFVGTLVRGVVNLPQGVDPELAKVALYSKRKFVNDFDRTDVIREYVPDSNWLRLPASGAFQFEGVLPSRKMVEAWWQYPQGVYYFGAKEASVGPGVNDLGVITAHNSMVRVNLEVVPEGSGVTPSLIEAIKRARMPIEIRLISRKVGCEGMGTVNVRVNSVLGGSLSFCGINDRDLDVWIRIEADGAQRIAGMDISIEHPQVHKIRGSAGVHRIPVPCSVLSKIGVKLLFPQPVRGQVRAYMVPKRGGSTIEFSLGLDGDNVASLVDVIPGRYTLLASLSGEGISYAGMQEVDTARDDIEVAMSGASGAKITVLSGGELQARKAVAFRLKGVSGEYRVTGAVTNELGVLDLDGLVPGVEYVPTQGKSEGFVAGPAGSVVRFELDLER